MNASRILRAPLAVGLGVLLLVTVVSILGRASSPVAAQAAGRTVPIAYRFDYPLGVPDGKDYGHGSLNGYDVHNTSLTDTTGFIENGSNLTYAELWHAGTDWFYRAGATKDGAHKPVYAVADGIVAVVHPYNYPGHVLVISHTLPNGGVIFSMYGHIENEAMIFVSAIRLQR